MPPLGKDVFIYYRLSNMQILSGNNKREHKHNEGISVYTVDADLIEIGVCAMYSPLSEVGPDIDDLILINPNDQKDDEMKVLARIDLSEKQND